MPPSPAAGRRHTELVGRDAQLAVLADRVAALADGRGGLVLLAGEPGIGKTRLAEEAVALARAAGAASIWAAAVEGDGAPPLWPWIQVLRRLGRSERALARTVDASELTPAARFAQSDAVAEELRTAAAAGPLIVVLDDLHWADSATVRVLAFVAATARSIPCLLLATYRADELPRADVAALARAGTTLIVPPLDDDAAGTLLARSVGGDVTAAAAAAIVERSAGNPLFVWEYGQLLAATGRRDVAPGAVPIAVAAVIERRLARIPQDALASLQAAAVLGAIVAPVDVARVAGVDEDAVDDAFGAAGSVGLLTTGDAAGRVAFAHALIRDVVLDGIGRERRADLHARAAELWAARIPAEPGLHALVAEHLQQAGPAHAASASEHWEAAARRATDVLADEEAAACFARARVGAAPRRQAELLADEGDARLRSGDLVGARRCFEEVVTAAAALGLPQLRARAALGIGGGPAAWEVPLGDRHHADLVAAALDALPADAHALRSMLLARLSVSAATPDTMDLARARAEDALSLAQRVGDDVLIGRALAAVADAYGGPAHTMRRREHADAIVELAMAAGDPMLELVGYRFRIVADLEAGDIAAADSGIEAFARLSAGLRHPLVAWYVPLFRGMRALLAGDLEAAARFRALVLDDADATGSVNARVLAYTLGWGIDDAIGAHSDDFDLATIFDHDPAEWASLAAGLAVAALVDGDRQRAGSLLRLHTRNGLRRVGDDGEVLVTLIMFGRVAVALGDLDAVGAVYGRLAPFAGLWSVDGIGACVWGPVDLDLGSLALALGRRDDARRHFADARAALARVRAPLLTAGLDAAAAALGDGEVTEAGATLAPAAGANTFRREGQFWTLGYRGRTIRVKDTKGLRDLDRLLAHPGVELHVLDLAGGPGERSGRGRPGGGDLGELLDAQARAEYRRRVGELDRELDDAEAVGDADRAERARRERDFIAAELAAALGLGGRPRRSGDPAERARKAVTGRIRLTIGRIEDDHPELARHLANSVRTGTYCVYEPEAVTHWEQGPSGIATRDLAPPG